MVELNWDAISEFFVFGFILGDKTMIKGRRLPQFLIPEVYLRPRSSLEEVYHALRNAIQKTLNEETNCAVTVSGGQDSRILACIVAELGFDIPAFTYYSAFEAKIAARVCDKLGLKHYYAPIGYDMNDAFLEKETKVIGELGGIKDVVIVNMGLRVQQMLDKLDVKTLIHGGRFNEVLGTGIPLGDVNTYFNRIANGSFPEWYQTRAYRSLCEYCSQMSRNEIFLRVTVQSTINRDVNLSY